MNNSVLQRPFLFGGPEIPIQGPIVKKSKTSEHIKKQGGYSLIEMLVVMSILAVLAGVVSTQVTGSGETSRDVRTLQDANSVDAAVAHYFFDQEGAELLSQESVTAINEGGIVITTSSKWPETPITSAYGHVFQETGSAIGPISFFNEDGTPAGLSVRGLLENYTAINFSALKQGDYVQSAPQGVDQTSEGFSNYLWLLRKDSVAGGGGKVSSREVEVFKLVTVQRLEGTGSDILNYKQVVGEF